MVMGIPDLSPLEQMKALEKLVKEIEKKHSDFAHRLNQMKYAREGRTPTEEFVKLFQDLCEEELRRVESDELVLANRKKTGLNPDEVLVNFVGKARTGPKGASTRSLGWRPGGGRSRSPRSQHEPQRQDAQAML